MLPDKTDDDDHHTDPQHTFSDALAALGLRAAEAGEGAKGAKGGEGQAAAAEPPADPEVYLWPCNEPVWQLWQRVQTQWHVGLGGPTGLRYEGVGVVMDFCGLPRKERAWAFECLQAMEHAALKVFESQHEHK